MRLLTALFFVSIVPTAVSAETLQSYVLYNFVGQANHMTPLVEGPGGDFYGVTPVGPGSDYRGTVFKVTTAGTFTTLVGFNGNNGQNPSTGLVLGGAAPVSGRFSA